ncbi:Lcl C-terminal domain-containing protein [Thiolapillus sp.]
MKNLIKQKMKWCRLESLMMLAGLATQGVAAEICSGAPGDLHDETYSAAQTTCTSSTRIDVGPNVIVVSGAWLSLYAPVVTFSGPVRVQDRAHLNVAPHYSGSVVLNDTGIVTCSDAGSNGLPCPVAAYPHQDAEYGRDKTHYDNADGHAGFSFTKLAADGNPLLATAASWSCVRDNVTGLIWEVKTSDGGIHDKANTYRWGGKTAQGSGYGVYYPDWNTLVDGSNTEQLCGFSDWRVPTRAELQSLVSYDRLAPDAVIDENYFPNTVNTHYWTAQPNAVDPSTASEVDFGMGFFGGFPRNVTLLLRLVRSGP